MATAMYLEHYLDSERGARGGGGAGGGAGGGWGGSEAAAGAAAAARELELRHGLGGGGGRGRCRRASSAAARHRCAPGSGAVRRWPAARVPLARPAALSDPGPAGHGGGRGRPRRGGLGGSALGSGAARVPSGCPMSSGSSAAAG